MADEGTISTLIVVGVVLQFIFTILLAAGAGILYSMLPILDMILTSIPPSELPPGLTIIDLANIWHFGVVALAGLAVLSFVLAILWITWRKEPTEHRTGLIITGIVSLVFTGFIAGLLVLIAGALAEKKTDTSPYSPPKPTTSPPGKGVVYCSACGAALPDPSAKFCGVCGAKTN
jgi:hypothetical protein